MPDKAGQAVRSFVQESLPAVFMRGGTSKALFFHRRDLPPAEQPHDNSSWNDIFLAALGSPDPRGRQLDGMGGGESSLSKVAVVGPSSRPGVDVEFTFAQVGIIEATVGYKGNCGNIISAVGPFAVDEGLVAVEGDEATVRIFNTNTGKIIFATFPLVAGRSAVAGDCVVQGVAGSGAPVRLAFQRPGGATTGKLIPTGAAREILQLADGRDLEVSLVDAGNPTVFLSASALGLTATERPSELRDNIAAMADFEAIRIAAALRMGLVASTKEAQQTVRNLPLVALLAGPRQTLAQDADITVRMISAGLPHRAIPLTGAICLAVASRVCGTVVHSHLPALSAGIGLRIAHPSGVMDVSASVAKIDGEDVAIEAVVYRTARRLMEGRVLLRP